MLLQSPSISSLNALLSKIFLQRFYDRTFLQRFYVSMEFLLSTPFSLSLLVYSSWFFSFFYQWGKEKRGKLLCLVFYLKFKTPLKPSLIFPLQMRNYESSAKIHYEVWATTLGHIICHQSAYYMA